MAALRGWVVPCAPSCPGLVGEAISWKAQCARNSGSACWEDITSIFLTKDRWTAPSQASQESSQRVTQRMWLPQGTERQALWPQHSALPMGATAPGVLQLLSQTLFPTVSTESLCPSALTLGDPAGISWDLPPPGRCPE